MKFVWQPEKPEEKNQQKTKKTKHKNKKKQINKKPNKHWIVYQSAWTKTQYRATNTALQINTVSMTIPPI